MACLGVPYHAGLFARVALAVDVALTVAGYALADTNGHVGAMPASTVAAITLTVALILAVIEHQD